MTANLPRPHAYFLVLHWPLDGARDLLCVLLFASGGVVCYLIVSSHVTASGGGAEAEQQRPGVCVCVCLKPRLRDLFPGISMS